MWGQPAVYTPENIKRAVEVLVARQGEEKGEVKKDKASEESGDA